MNEKISSEGREQFKVDPDVVEQAMGEEMVLVHLTSNRIHSLNATALRLWELLSQGLTRGEIERELLSEFDVDRETLGTEIDATLAQLKAARLIVTTEADQDGRS